MLRGLLPCWAVRMSIRWPAAAVSFDQHIEIEHVTLKRMDNIGIVVEDLGEAIDFLRELGLELEGRATIEGEWAGRVTGLGDQHVEIAMMRTPDGGFGASLMV
jgi:hypothetical protein